MESYKNNVEFSTHVKEVASSSSVKSRLVMEINGDVKRVAFCWRMIAMVKGDVTGGKRR